MHPQSTTSGFLLSIDVGTSNSVAVLRRPDGSTRPLLITGVPVTPSAIFLDQSGALQVGRDAQRLGLLDPARYEPNPKQRIDDQSLFLGDREVPLVDALAALLVAVGRAAVEATSFLPPVLLTYPATWQRPRQAILRAAAARAGFPPVKLVPEPVGAARYFTDVLRRPVPVGGTLGIFDFGGGTLDIAVLRRDATGFAVAASGGAPDLGGLDIDAAIVGHLAPQVSPVHPSTWQAITAPADGDQRRARRLFWEEVRTAKEMLSRTSSAPIALPGLSTSLHLTRDELNQIVGPLLDRAVAEAGRVLRQADVNPRDLTGLFLVGGSSRLPELARLLHVRLGIAPTVLEQPELPVAEGALALFGPIHPADQQVPPGPGPTPVVGPARGTPSAPVAADFPDGPGPAAHLPRSAPPQRTAGWVDPAGAGPDAPPRWRRPALLVTAGLVALLLVAAGTGLAVWRNHDSKPPVAAPLTKFTALQALGSGVPYPSSIEPSNAFVSADAKRAIYGYGQADRLTLNAIDLTTGQPAWGPVVVKSSYDRWGGMGIEGDKLVVFNQSNETANYALITIDASNGRELWRSEQNDSANQNYFLFAGHTAVVSSESASTIVGYNLRTGKEAWRRPTAPYIYPVYGEEDLSLPTALYNGSFNTENIADRKLIYKLDSNHQVTLMNPDTGAVVAAPVGLVSDYLTHLAVGNQLFVFTGNSYSNYEVRVVDLAHPSAGRVLANVNRGLGGLGPNAAALCGVHLLCVLDGSPDTAQVVAFDTIKGGEVWRKPAPGALFLSTVGTSVLAFNYLDQSPVNYLYDKAGVQRMSAAEQKGLAIRVSGTGLLWLDKSPLRNKAGLAVGKPVDVEVHGIDPTGRSTTVGEVSDVLVSTCAVTSTMLTCAGLQPGQGNAFRAWRFAGVD